MLFFLNFLFIKVSWKKVSQVSNIDNKSALHKMHFKIYKKFDQYIYVYIIFIFFTLPLFYIWAPAPEELSARPWW